MDHRTQREFAYEGISIEPTGQRGQHYVIMYRGHQFHMDERRYSTSLDITAEFTGVRVYSMDSMSPADIRCAARAMDEYLAGQ